MTTGSTTHNKHDRRLAFRIYQEANLFYRIIGQTPWESQSGPATGIAQLPDSQSLENDTLKVNISASGLAFTSKDPLNPGDHLAVRLLLLSNLTSIMACCQVVYCKPGNPYEKDRYPFLIGARFVNLTAQDSALLDNYINRRKIQQRLFYAFYLSLAMTVLLQPELAFDLIVDIGHQLLELVLHVLHVLFEFVEYSLDHLVEHLFHTDLHTTQFIVFYLMLGFALTLCYALWRIIPPMCLRFGNNQRAFWSRKKASMTYYWHQQTLAEKIRLAGITAGAIACYGFFAL